MNHNYFMTKAELKDTLETIIAANPIPTQFNCGGDVSMRDVFATMRDTGRGWQVTVDTTWSTQPKKALEILWKIRNALSLVCSVTGDNTVRGNKKATTSGFWHMGRFNVECTSREFWTVEA